MGQAVSKTNKDYINNNWNKLKCSPIGPFLQMLGIAPGSSNSTANLCKSSAFSSQFNSSMGEHINQTKNLSGSLNIVSDTMNKFRKVIASIEQRAFEDLAKVANQLFKIYVKIGNIFYVIVKNLINIMNIFKQTVNFSSSVAKLLIAFMNLLRVPVNGVINFVQFFTR
jgi:phage-related minor tail protein